MIQSFFLYLITLLYTLNSKNSNHDPDKINLRSLSASKSNYCFVLHEKEYI